MTIPGALPWDEHTWNPLTAEMSPSQAGAGILACFLLPSPAELGEKFEC